MIINALFLLIKGLLRLLLSPLTLITFPASVASVVARFIEIIAEGSKFVSAFFHPSYVGGLLAFVISVAAFMNGYRFIMWILRKIPIFNID